MCFSFIFHISGLSNNELTCRGEVAASLRSVSSDRFGTLLFYLSILRLRISLIREK
jgi:hypothetical protein